MSALAGRGLRVANVPLVLGVQPPKELFEVPEDRVVALTIGQRHPACFPRERQTSARVLVSRQSEPPGPGVPQPLLNAPDRLARNVLQLRIGKSTGESHQRLDAYLTQLTTPEGKKHARRK